MERLSSSATQLATIGRLHYEIGLLCTYEDRYDEAAASFEKALAMCRSGSPDPKIRTDLIAMLGIVALRRGEIDNCIECLGPSSCIFPIAREAVHQHPAGSREAIKQMIEITEGADSFKLSTQSPLPVPNAR